MEAGFWNIVDGKLSAMDKHNVQQRQLDGIKSRIAKLEAEQPVLQERIAGLQAGLAAAETSIPTKTPIDTGIFDRPVDRTIVRARCKVELSKKAVVEAIEEVLKEMSLNTDQVDTVGTEPSKGFTIQFKGESGLAENRAKKFLQLQRLPSGWRRLIAADEKEEAQTLFVDADKNQKTIRTEIATKKLSLVLDKHFPAGKKTHAKRSEGKVFQGFTPLARIQAEPEELRTEWNSKHPEAQNLDREKIDAELRSALGAAIEDPAWG